MAIGPFEVGYPIDFRHNGDTVKEFAGKTIKEVERIYNFMNAMYGDMVTMDEVNSELQNIESKLNAHKDSTSPHPNWLIDLARQVTGNLPASRVQGNLDSATISHGKVNGLEDYIAQKMSEQATEFVCDEGISTQGYAKFSDFQICFGRELVKNYSDHATNETTLREVIFEKPFKKHSAVVILTLADDDETVSANKNIFPQLNIHTPTGFTYHLEAADAYQDFRNLEIEYIAIGH